MDDCLCGPGGQKMRRMRLALVIGLWLFVDASQPERLSAEKQASMPPGAAQCNLTIPINIELVPIDGLHAGQTARFQVRIDSDLDPSQVQKMWVEYDAPAKIQPASRGTTRLEILRKRGRQVHEFGVTIPDRKRHEIRARIHVRLVDGTTLARTAVRYVDLGRNPPEGMIGRLADPDGTGIRIYQGKALGD
jgi:hypothetical protein